MENVQGTNLNALVAFHVLLEERSVTRAAARLGLTQSAMSNALSGLRERFEDPLFVRGRGGMRPTDRALSLAEDLRLGIAAFERVLTPPAGFDPAQSRVSFVIATNDYMDLVLLPRLVDHLRERAPGCTLQVLPWGHYRELPPGLERGEVDVLLHPSGGRRLPRSFRREALFEDRFVALIRSDHPRIRGRLTRKRYLAESHVVVTEELGGAGSIDANLAREGARRTISVRVPRFYLVPHIVAGTNLIGAIDERIATLFTSTLPLRRLPIPTDLPRGVFHMVWHQRSERDPAREWLRAQITELAAEVDG
jgi:DNA-binding transcriptional LysR family regulator